MDANGDDPFDSITKLCVLSESQEDVLRRCSFAGDPISVSGSFFSQIFQPHSPSGVSMASLPESSEQRERISPHDSHQAPPEHSGGQRPMDVDDLSLGDAATVVEGGCVAAGVDLGKNAHLGFPLEVESTEQTAEIEILGVRRREISETEAGGEGESAPKRLKSSKEAGSASSVPLIVENLEVDHDSEESADESVRVAENSGQLDEENVSNGEETHHNNTQTRRVLPATMNGAKKTDPTPSGSCKKKPSPTIKDILKIFAQGETSEEDKRLAKMNIVEILSHRGWTFPRPVWWPEGWDFSFK